MAPEFSMYLYLATCFVPVGAIQLIDTLLNRMATAGSLTVSRASNLSTIVKLILGASFLLGLLGLLISPSAFLLGMGLCGLTAMLAYDFWVAKDSLLEYQQKSVATAN